MSMALEILVPDGVALQSRVVGLRAADSSGQFGLWPGHEAFLTLLVPCVLSFREEQAPLAPWGRGVGCEREAIAKRAPSPRTPLPSSTDTQGEGNQISPPLTSGGDRERYAAVDGGVLVVEKDRVSVVTREAVIADRLEEVADAAAAMLEARRLLERTARAEFTELQTSLLRELRKVEKPR